MTHSKTKEDRKDASQAVLNRIAAEKITPRPGWHFVAKERVMWATGIGCVLCGAVVISLLLLVTSNNIWELRKALNPETVRSLLIIVPLLWIGLFAFFLIAAEYNVRHTKSGYRYSLWAIVSLPLVTSISLGMVFYQLGVSHMIDEMLEHSVPHYKSFESRRGAVLHNPEEGQVAGVVVRKDADQIVVVRSVGNTQWNIDTSRLSQRHIENIAVGAHVVAFGAHSDDDNLFAACALRVLPRKGFREQHVDRDSQKRELREGDDYDKRQKQRPERRRERDERMEQKIQNFAPCVHLQEQEA